MKSTPSRVLLIQNKNMSLKVTNLEDLKKVFQKIKKPIIGIGVTAFNRLGLEDVAPSHSIVCLRYSLDTKIIEKEVKVYSLERGRPTRHLKCRRNATAIILNRRTQKYLKKLPEKPALIFYKTTEKIQKECQKKGWLMVGNSPRFGKEGLENKVFFRHILDKCGFDPIPGETSNLANLDFATLNKKYGPHFVIQLPDRGGGKGTFFINQKEDFDNFVNHERVKEYPAPPEVVITKFIPGPSPSITACVTREGILSTNLQYQLLDIPELWNLKKGCGLFSGHDWTQSNFTDRVQKQAYSFTQKVGEYFTKMGYKGIFGLDLILDQDTEKLYVVECNPRLLGSFPCLPMVQIVNREPPLLGFHVLEFLNANYRLNLKRINDDVRQQKLGSQMILHNLLYKWAENKGELPAGVYQYKKGRFSYQREGYHFKHLKDKDEFLLADGVPIKNSKLTPNQRLLRILTLRGVMDLRTYKLNDWGHKVAQWTYQQLKITPLPQQPEYLIDD